MCLPRVFNFAAFDFVKFAFKGFFFLEVLRVDIYCSSEVSLRISEKYSVETNISDCVCVFLERKTERRRDTERESSRFSRDENVAFHYDVSR